MNGEKQADLALRRGRLCVIIFFDVYICNMTTFWILSIFVMIPHELYFFYFKLKMHITKFKLGWKYCLSFFNTT